MSLGLKGLSKQLYLTEFMYMLAAAVLHGFTPLSKKPLLRFTYTTEGMALVAKQPSAVATIQRSRFDRSLALPAL